MTTGSVEARLKSLEARLKSLSEDLEAREKKIQQLEDIEAIKRLQCAYGYYPEHMMGDEIVDCFSNSPEVSATFVEGTYYGPEGVRRYFKHEYEPPPNFLHMVMQVSPVITLDPDGIHAKGRWYGYGNILSHYSQPLDPAYMAVIYEMDYIREDGVWKILTLRLMMHFAYSHGPGGRPQGPPEREGEERPRPPQLRPDRWADYNTEYPSGYIYPMHYVHPVTGKPSTEAKRNAKLKLGPNKYRPPGK
jgi:hypothetical protein